jgi:VanZ family protein
MTAGVAFFATAEGMQLFLRSRTADVVDLGANVLGMVVGVLVTAAVADGPAGDRQAPRRRLLFSAALGIAALVYAAYNLSPFDFSFSSELVAGRIGRLTNVPFHGYYLNQEFKALRDVFVKVGLALPLGVFFVLRFRPDRLTSGRAVTAGWLLLTALFFTAVEAGQVILPSRYPDNTDVLLAVAAVWLGTRITRRFGHEG